MPDSECRLKTSAIKRKHTYRLAITGPESTGKSELAEKLASHYKSQWVAEYSREYLRAPVRKYDYEDILEIAKGQYRNEEELAKTAGQFLFCDTEFIVAIFSYIFLLWRIFSIFYSIDLSLIGKVN